MSEEMDSKAGETLQTEDDKIRIAMLEEKLASVVGELQAMRSAAGSLDAKVVASEAELKSLRAAKCMAADEKLGTMLELKLNMMTHDDTVEDARSSSVSDPSSSGDESERNLCTGDDDGAGLTDRSAQDDVVVSTENAAPAPCGASKATMKRRLQRKKGKLLREASALGLMPHQPSPPSVPPPLPYSAHQQYPHHLQQQHYQPEYFVQHGGTVAIPAGCMPFSMGCASPLHHAQFSPAWHACAPGYEFYYRGSSQMLVHVLPPEDAYASHHHYWQPEM